MGRGLSHTARMESKWSACLLLGMGFFLSRPCSADEENIVIPVLPDQAAASAADARPLSPLGDPVLFDKISRRGPVAGVPVPWDLKDSSTVALRRMRVEARLRASETELKVVLSLLNRTDKERRVSMAVPLAYEAPLEGALLTDRKKVSATRVVSDDRELNYQYREGTPHPMKDAPSMEGFRDISDWLCFDVDFKGNQELLVEVTLILPYSQDMTLAAGKENLSAARLGFLMNSARLWRDELHWGVLALENQEMGADCLKIVRPAGFKLGKKNEGWYEFPLTSESLSAREPFLLEVQPPVQLSAANEGADVKIEGMGQGKSLKDYTVRASSVLEGTSPDNVKTGAGGWAEGVSGDGREEWVELTWEHPVDLMGLIYQGGRNPSRMGDEEKKHPDLTYSFYGSPAKIVVTVNGSHSFPVTLREDWNTQFVIPPYACRNIKNIKVTLDRVHGGKAADDTFISRLVPVVKKR